LVPNENMFSLQRTATLVGWCVIAASLGWSQDPRGSITGRVTDQSGALIPGARMHATNQATGVSAVATTNQSGNFVMPFLVPGTYTVTAEAQGFKKYSRSGIQLRVSDTAEVNISMEIGQVAETVEVTSKAPLLDTAAASLGQVVAEKHLLELPLNAGNPIELMYLTPGMVNPATTMPPMHAPWTGMNTQSNGNPGGSNDFSIDGVPNTFPNGISRGVRPALNPPTTAVSEFRIQTTSYDASVGHSVGASVNVSTKGGSNEFHGGAHWFLKNSALDTPSYFDRLANRKLDAYRYNRAGLDIGGPVLFPGYNGRNRTFFFYTHERTIWQVPEPRLDTVPTPAQRNGDFSGLLALGSQYQIYDPFSAVTAPNGRLSRSPFPNNIVPQSLMDPVGRKLVGFYPEPNMVGTRDGANNYYTPAVAGEDYWVHLARIDHAISENHRVFVRLDIARWDEDQLRRLGPSNPASGLLTSSRDKGLALDYVGILSPQMVFNFRYGLTYQERADHRVSQGWDLAGLGFSKTLVSLIDSKQATIPELVLDGYARMSRFWTGDGSNTGLTHSFNGNFTTLWKEHSMKYGVSFRAYRSFGDRHPYSTSPYFRFGSTYTRGPLDNAAGSPLGQDLAALLMGLPSSGYMEMTPSFALNGPSLGLYFQDDYKLTRKLTVNLGLRWEYDLPVTERYNRLVAQFDGTTSNPIEAAARANYAKSPIAEIPAANFRVLGGLTWVNEGGRGRTAFSSSRTNFMPRVGLAYQLTQKTVLRGGYGMFYDTVGVNQTVPIQTGYAQSTPVQVSMDDGLTFVTRMSDPLPNGLIQPAGSKGGLATNLNQSLSVFHAVRKTPYSQRWSLGVQHLLPGQLVIDTSYVGNRGTRLEISRNLNGVPTSYLSTSFFRDQTAIDYLSQRMANPFYGTNPIYGSAITRADLLRPYPQFGSITIDDPVGYSWYHALQMSLEKRFSQGFTGQMSYTFSKLMQATEFLNAADPMPYETLSSTDRPHILALSAVWEVPVGRGRRFGAGMPKVLDALVGGLQVSTVYKRQSGAPLEFGDAIFTGNIKDIALSGDERTVTRWFNTDAGFNRVASQQRSYSVRSFPLRFAHVRGDAQRRWDLAVKKNFNLTEQVKLEFRAESLNVDNADIFGPPNTSVTSSSFGRVTSVAWPGRQWQFVLKLRF